MLENINFTDPVTLIVIILVGLAVLLLGRKLFWLFVGAVGFIIGLSLAVELLAEQPEWVVLVAALIIGLVGALVAIFVQKVAVIMAGFVMGGIGLIWLVQLFSLSLVEWNWLIFVIGGLVGAIVVAVLFEAALIVLSALTGAALLVEVAGRLTNFGALISAGLFMVLIAIGILVQIQMWRERTSG